MQKIIEYYALSRSNIFDLNEAVNTQIRLGWQPFGNIRGLGVCHYIQIMVKYSEEIGE